MAIKKKFDGHHTTGPEIPLVDFKQDPRLPRKQGDPWVSAPENQYVYMEFMDK